MNISYIKFHSKLESVAETHHNFKMDGEYVNTNVV